MTLIDSDIAQQEYANFTVTSEACENDCITTYVPAMFIEMRPVSTRNPAQAETVMNILEFHDPEHSIS